MCLAALFSNSAWHGDSSTHCVMSVFYYSMGGSRNKYLPTSPTTLFLTKKCYFFTSEHQLACHSQYSTYLPPVYNTVPICHPSIGIFSFSTLPHANLLPFVSKKTKKSLFEANLNTRDESSRRLIPKTSRLKGS